MSQARFVVGALALLAVGWVARMPPPRVTGCHFALGHARTAPVVEFAPGGPYRALEFQSARVDSLEMPRWFGAPTVPQVRIAGKVFGAHGPMTVRIAVNVPAPGIWPGRVVALQPDGTFDFGPMRAGSYLVVAYGGDVVSQITPVDTLNGPGDRAVLIAAPCQRLRGAFSITSDRESRDPVPAADVAIELSGWVVGTTDGNGAYDVCVPDKTDDANLRVPGFADPPTGYHKDRFNRRMLWPEHLVHGIVLDADGQPAANVGVQPIWSDNENVELCRPSTVVLTTAGPTFRRTGWFSYNDANRPCGFRIFRGTMVYDQLFDGMKYDNPQVIQLPAGGESHNLFDARIAK